MEVEIKLINPTYVTINCQVVVLQIFIENSTFFISTLQLRQLCFHGKRILLLFVSNRSYHFVWRSSVTLLFVNSPT